MQGHSRGDSHNLFAQKRFVRIGEERMKVADSIHKYDSNSQLEIATLSCPDQCRATGECHMYEEQNWRSDLSCDRKFRLQD